MKNKQKTGSLFLLTTQRDQRDHIILIPHFVVKETDRERGLSGVTQSTNCYQRNTHEPWAPGVSLSLILRSPPPPLLVSKTQPWFSLQHSGPPPGTLSDRPLFSSVWIVPTPRAVPVNWTESENKRGRREKGSGVSMMGPVRPSTVGTSYLRSQPRQTSPLLWGIVGNPRTANFSVFE